MTSNINPVYYLGKGEVGSSILPCSTMKTPDHKGLSGQPVRQFSEERGKNIPVATGENPWKDVHAMSTTSVYIIECAGYVKIGVAKNPLERLATINTGTPVLASLYGHREFDHRLVAYNVESQLHRKFRSARANGEWFSVSAAEALDALMACRVRKVTDRTARHDSLKRWDFSEDDETITNLLTRG